MKSNRYGYYLQRVELKHITAVGIAESGRLLSVAYRLPPPNLFSQTNFSRMTTLFNWRDYPKAQRIALLRELPRMAPQARFSGFAGKIMDGSFPRAVS